MISFPDKLNLAMLPTPLEPLERLSAEIGGPRVWVKRDDLTGSITTGNKVRKLEYTLARAIAEGADTIITCGGLQSNHCRATAILGAKLGLKVHLILRGSEQDSPDGNLFLDYLAGAGISSYPQAEYQKSLPQLIRDWELHYQSQGRHVYCIPTGASDGVGVWGYVDCARELKQQLEAEQITPGAIIHATGSGGTQAGLTAGASLFQIEAPVIGMAVCDDEHYFLRKVKKDLQDWQKEYALDVDVDNLNIQVNDQYIGTGYAEAGREVFETIKKVAQLEGLVLDPVYTGKAFHGLISELRKGTFHQEQDIIFIHTGGVFGLLAQREQLEFDSP